MGFALSNMQLTSTAFGQGESIPVKHTGEGEDKSPQLAWTDAPDGTRSFAIICHDPDAPLITPQGTYGFVHWVAYNIPAGVNKLEEGSSEYTSGQNDFGSQGYGGPMPPNGHGTHQYYYWVLALDSDDNLDEGQTLWQLLARIESSVIGMNRLVGTYRRD